MTININNGLSQIKKEITSKQTNNKKKKNTFWDCFFHKKSHVPITNKNRSILTHPYNQVNAVGI